jgi:hypothetical protein
VDEDSGLLENLMLSAILGFLARLIASVIQGWRRDALLKNAGAAEAELRGLEDVYERARKARAAELAVTPDNELRDDPNRRD